MIAENKRHFVVLCKTFDMFKRNTIECFLFRRLIDFDFCTINILIDGMKIYLIIFLEENCLF